MIMLRVRYYLKVTKLAMMFVPIVSCVMERLMCRVKGHIRI